MFINFTNHPSQNWSPEQLAAASVYGEIRDIPFPNVNPTADDEYIEFLAEEYAAMIFSLKPAAVLCQGEMTLAFAVASILLKKCGITVLAACSERIVAEIIGKNGETVKRAEFKFTRFRKYLM